MTDGGDGSDDEYDRWRVSRRRVVGATAVGLIGGLAGCGVGSPHDRVSLEVTVRDSFDPDPSASIPVTVSGTVQGVETTEVALRGVDVVTYDADREPLGTRSIGDISWETVDPERRETEEYDGWIGTTTVYSADRNLETTVEADTVPEWITFDVEEVHLPSEDDEAANSGPVGLASASQPPPDFSAWVQQYDAVRPSTSTIGPGDYRSHRLTRSRQFPGREDGPLLPSPTPDPGSGTTPPDENSSVPSNSSGNRSDTG